MYETGGSGVPPELFENEGASVWHAKIILRQKYDKKWGFGGVPRIIQNMN